MTLCQKVFFAMLSRSFHRKMILCNGYLVTLITKACLKWWNLKKTMTVQTKLLSSSFCAAYIHTLHGALAKQPLN